MAVTVRGHGQVVRVRSESWDVSVRSPEKFKMGVETGIPVPGSSEYEVVPSPEERIVLVDNDPWAISVKSPERKTMGVETGILVAAFPDYEGVYEVIPAPEEQILETARKTMREDLTVHSIPYHKTSNESGGYTVSIAS